MSQFYAISQETLETVPQFIIQVQNLCYSDKGANEHSGKASKSETSELEVQSLNRTRINKEDRCVIILPKYSYYRIL